MDVWMRMTTIGMVLQLCCVSEYLFHKRVRLVKSVQSTNHLVCLESSRWYVKMMMLRLVMGQLGLSLDDETLQLWWNMLLETTLHLTKFVADSRRVFHKSSIWRHRQ